LASSIHIGKQREISLSRKTQSPFYYSPSQIATTHESKRRGYYRFETTVLIADCMIESMLTDSYIDGDIRLNSVVRLSQTLSIAPVRGLGQVNPWEIGVVQKIQGKKAIVAFPSQTRFR
jgi:hypothetical protein